MIQILLLCTCIKSRSIFHQFYSANLTSILQAIARKGGFIDYAVASAVSDPSQVFLFCKIRIDITFSLHFNKPNRCTKSNLLKYVSSSRYVLNSSRVRSQMCTQIIRSTFIRFFRYEVKCFVGNHLIAWIQIESSENNLIARIQIGSSETKWYVVEKGFSTQIMVGFKLAFKNKALNTRVHFYSSDLETVSSLRVRSSRLNNIKGVIRSKLHPNQGSMACLIFKCTTILSSRKKTNFKSSWGKTRRRIKPRRLVSSSKIKEFCSEIFKSQKFPSSKTKTEYE